MKTRKAIAFVLFFSGLIVLFINNWKLATALTLIASACFLFETTMRTPK